MQVTNSPTVTVYTPSGASYLKVTPHGATQKMVVRPRVLTENLIYAPLITHKIADTTTTIGAADPDDLAKSKTAADEILADCNTHIASTTYHVAAGTAFYAGHKEDDATNLDATAAMSNLATGYALADALCTAFIAHTVSTVFHKAATAFTFTGTPNSESLLRAKVNALRTAMLAHTASTAAHSVADVENLRLVTATTAGSDEASDQTLINLLQGYYNSHLAVGDATAGDLAAVIVAANAAKAAVLAHMLDSTVAHGGTGDATQYATLAAVADASDQTTSNTLLHALKDTYNAHCAILDNGSYVAVFTGRPFVWESKGSFFCKTSQSAGVFTTTEMRSVVK